MAFENSTVTLGGETREVNSLPFMQDGELIRTSREGGGTVKYGAYTFIFGPNKLGYRFKAEGKKVSSPLKALTSFAELDSLPLGVSPSAVATPVTPEKDDTKVATITDETAVSQETTKSFNALSAKEEIVMAKKINLGNGAQLDLSAEETALLVKGGIKTEIAELSEVNTAGAKLKTEKDIAAFKELNVKIDAALDAADKKENPPAGTGADKTGEGKADTTKLNPASVFGQGGGKKAVAAGDQKRPKTEEEKKAARAAKEQKTKEAEDAYRENIGLLDEARKAQAEIQGADEAIEALAKLMLIDGQLPLFKTLVPSDTRLRPTVRNLIKAKDREYHEKFAGKPGMNQTGSKIPLNQAKGLYELVLTESNPSPPRGFFIYVPRSLMDFNPSLISSYNERQKVIKALEAPEDEDRVIKLYLKEDFVNLLILLDSPQVREYKAVANSGKGSFVDSAPIIRLVPKPDSKTGMIVHTLRATDAQGQNTKLSIRNFIPTYTHDTTTLASLDMELTTKLLFERLVFTTPNGYPDNKYNQMTPESQMMFDMTNDTRTPIFNGFANTFEVKAYDSKDSEGRTVTVKLPLVEMSQPATGTPRPRFSRTKHGETGYGAEYAPLVAMVGDQLQNVRPRSAQSIRDTSANQVAMAQARNSILAGHSVPFR